MKEKLAEEASIPTRTNEMYVDGHLLEIAINKVSEGDLGVADPHLLDGFSLCPGCMDVFVLRDYCASCRRTNASLESRFADRIDTGVVPFEELETLSEPPPLGAIAAILFGALCSVMFFLTGIWYVGRSLIGICLEKGW